MFLNGEQIKDRLSSDKKIEGKNFDSKLIIVPILDINNQVKDDAVSIDLRLGTKFLFSNKFNIGEIDPASMEYSNRQYASPLEINFGKKLTLHPSQFVLGETLEWIKMPNDLLGIISAKSSDARDGIQIEMANLIHPRFSGPITLELSNNGEVPYDLYPGVPIAQLALAKIVPISKVTPMSKSNFPFQFESAHATRRKKDLDIIFKLGEMI